jgi:hypothetical protein
MYICDDKEFVFLCLPNSGSRATSSWLGRYGTRQIYHHHNFIIPRHARSYFVFAVVRNPYAKAVSYWSFTKNKGHQITKTATFEEYACWLNDPKFSPQIRPIKEMCRGYLARYKKVPEEHLAEVTKYLMAHSQLQGRTMTSSQQLSFAHHVDKVVHLENLNEELQELPFVKEEVSTKLVGRNKRAHRDWRAYYNTPEVEEHIYEYFKQDFEAFGYERITPNTSPSQPRKVP